MPPHTPHTPRAPRDANNPPRPPIGSREAKLRRQITRRIQSMRTDELERAFRDAEDRFDIGTMIRLAAEMDRRDAWVAAQFKPPSTG